MTRKKTPKPGSGLNKNGKEINLIQKLKWN